MKPIVRDPNKRTSRRRRREHFCGREKDQTIEIKRSTHVLGDVCPHLFNVVVATLELRRATPDVVDADQEGLVFSSLALLKC